MGDGNKRYCKSPIFVVGTPRSGTTLTAMIIGRHSEIFMPGETHFFDDIFSQRNVLGDPSNPIALEKIISKLSTLYIRYNEPDDQERVERILFNNQNSIEAFKKSCKSYQDILSFFMKAQLEEIGKSRWGNNAPRDIFNIQDIVSFYPDAKIIICIRDIRDFLASYRNRWEVVPDEHAERVKQIYHPILTSILWKSSVRTLPSIRKIVPKHNLLLMKYEDLVTSPEESVKRLCSFLGERFEQQMLNINSNNSSFNNTQNGIFSSSVNRWPDSLSAEEQAIAQRIGGSELRMLGYRESPTQANPIELIKLCFSFLLVFNRAMRLSKSYRGAAFPYLMRRLHAFLKVGIHRTG